MTNNKMDLGNDWVVVYPGQGSQYIGMGKDLYDAFPYAKSLFDFAEELSEKKLTKFCFTGPISKLSNTDVLQVATTVTNLSVDAFLAEKKPFTPSVVLGHSVGEYSALCKAGVISAQDAIRLTIARGQLMQREAKLHKGQMLAVKDVSAAEVQALLDSDSNIENIVIANDNAPNQQVISGSKSDMGLVMTMLSNQGVEYVKLPVSGAWHSPLMRGAVEDFSKIVQSIEFHAPQITVIGNLKAKPYESVKEIQESLVNHLIDKVRWTESIQHLLDQGYRQFIEVGPKKVLSRLISTIASETEDITVLNVESISDIESL